jgi:iron complex outermembrane recepter protein
MKSRSLNLSGISLTLLTLVFFPIANAADAENAEQLGEITVTADKNDIASVPANLPATTESVTAKKIEESVNAVTSAETLKYLPSIVVRERFIGDRNGIVSTRTTGTLSSAQSIVYADNLLLSNFLGNGYANPPRWGMVSPEEIARVDVIYGPFSALYPGNSMGGVILMTTRMPEKFEAHAKVDAFQQRFKLYGTNETYNSGHASASLGNKSGDWSFRINADHLDTHGHPMSFATATPGGAGTVVTGQYNDIDPTGKARIITGAYGIDQSVQDNAKIKLAYDVSPTVRATYSLGIWQLNSDTSVDTYLHDSAGNPVYNGNISIGGVNYKTSGLSPSNTVSEHLMHGLSVKSDTGKTFDWEVVASLYDYNKDLSRSGNYTANNGVDLGTGAIRLGGKLTNMEGTGWQNLDLRGEIRPDGDLNSKQQISFGYHIDRYVLNSASYTIPNTADWLTGAAGALSSNSLGKTQTQALYFQDAWKFSPDWKFVLGGRLEHWQAFDGSNYTGTNNWIYADRVVSNFSPKVSFSVQPTMDWTLRYSLGKVYRYPTVGEMFQTIKVGNTETINNPNLMPEQVVSEEFTAEKMLQSGLLRMTAFSEYKQDALISQKDITTTPGMEITSIQNVDKVATVGLETALQYTDFLLQGFDLSGSVTYVVSKILKDTQHPSYEWNDQPRIPDWRATLLGLYRATEQLSYSLGIRYSGRQYGNLDNSDTNGDTFGGSSKYLIADVKVLYKMDKQWSAAFGVDNLNNYKAYVYHPYPQRTVFASLKFAY